MIKQFQNFAIAGVLVSSLIPANIQSPQDLGEWLERDFVYQADCEDAAFLSQYVLNKLNYYTQVIVVVGTFDGKFGAHAICLFKNKENKWEHFSNYNYLSIPFDNIIDLLKFYYPKYKYYYTITLEDRKN